MFGTPLRRLVSNALVLERHRWVRSYRTSSHLVGHSRGFSTTSDEALAAQLMTIPEVRVYFAFLQILQPRLNHKPFGSAAGHGRQTILRGWQDGSRSANVLKVILVYFHHSPLPKATYMKLDLQVGCFAIAST
jgi:hypothetical protein